MVEQRCPYPEIVVVIASAAWGLYWIPLRAFERQDLEPAWATLTQFIAPLVILTPFAVIRWRRGPERNNRAGVVPILSQLLNRLML